MPRRIPAETKRQAVGMLQLHDDISLTHYLTGVHRRTLRHWRKELRQRQSDILSDKTFSSDKKRTENENSDRNIQPADPADARSEDQAAVSDYENLAHIRAKLMDYARQMTDDLSPDQPDASRRTLALSRVLDRIQMLDKTLLELQPKQRPPWQDAYEALLELDISPYELTQIEEMAGSLDESLRGRVYEYYRANHAERIRKERQRYGYLS